MIIIYKSGFDDDDYDLNAAIAASIADSRAADESYVDTLNHRDQEEVPSIDDLIVRYMSEGMDIEEARQIAEATRKSIIDRKLEITTYDYGHLTPIASDYLAKNLLRDAVIAARRQTQYF